MRRFVLVTCLSPGVLLILEPAAAQTSVSTGTTARLRTSTTGDVSITSDGSITPGVAGAAVTIDSDNSVTNAGTITFTDIDDATGIAAQTGTAGSITNSGTISITETDASADTDDDGDDDTPFAAGSGRTGIHVTGSGAFTGSVTNSGTITVTGNESAGIAIDGALDGSLTSSGTITVVGTGSYGVRAQAVTGDVTLSGTISAQGESAAGVSLDGDIGGGVTIAGTVTATGFRSTSTASTDDADDLLIGGAAVQIGGDVAGGVLIADDDDLGTGSVISYGSAPALSIGSAGDITIGAVADSAYGLVNAGSITASGITNGISAAAIRIGGAGGAVTIAGGIDNQGTIGSSSGAGTTTSYGILIGANAAVPALVNSGSIYASSTGSDATSTAIRDLSGTLTSIANTGAISAAVSSGYVAGQSVALDLSANTSGVTVTQALSDVDDATAPSITGDILTGSGDDRIALSSGSVTGDIALGAGRDTVTVDSARIEGAIDFSAGAGGRLALSGTGRVTGDVTFGADAAMVIADSAVFTGAVIQKAGAFSLDVAGGSFAVTNTGTISLSDLSVGSTGSITVNIDMAAGTNTLYQVAGAAVIASGATVSLNLSEFLTADTGYTILTAGSLSGGAGLTLDAGSLPYLFAASLSANDSAGTIAVDLRRKTATELGLNRSETSAYDAVYTAIMTDADVEGIMLGVNDAASFRKTYSMFVPDHGGGTFLSAMSASRAVGALATDPATPRVGSGPFGMWIGQIAGYQNKSAGLTSAYHTDHVAFAGGIEYRLGGLGTVGLSAAKIYSSIYDGANGNETFGDQSEIGAYWRGRWGGLSLNARGAVSKIDFESTRTLSGYLGSALIEKTSKAGWNGTMTSFGAGAGYELTIGRKFSLRPNVAIDYFKLDEDAHSESGGGTAFDLAIARRTSDQLALFLGLAGGMQLVATDDFGLRAEIEGGNRKVLRGSIGATTANFEGGTPFTLLPDALADGPVVKARLSGGTEIVSLAGEVRAEEVQSDISLGLRLSLRIKL